MRRKILVIFLMIATLFAVFACTPRQQKGGADILGQNITYQDTTVVYTGEEFEVAFKGTLVDLSTYYYTYNGKNQETPFKFKDVGSYTVKLTIENPNYNTYEKTIVFTITKATPEITALPVASQIRYGQLLSESRLTGGTSNVRGTFAWARPDTKPNVATARTDGYEVLFTPEDTLNYEIVSMQITFVVEKVIPTIDLVFPTIPDTTIYGTKFADIEFNNDGTVAEYGTFVWKNPEVIPTVGDIATTVIFEPSENYDFSHGYVLTKDVVVKINPALLTVAAVAQTYTYGDVMTFNEAVYTGRYYEITGFVNGETIKVVKTLPTFETVVTDAGRYANHIVYSGAVADNYAFYYKPATLIIEKFTPTILTVPTAAGLTYGQRLNESELTGGSARGVNAEIPGEFRWAQGMTAPVVADSNVTEFAVNFVPEDSQNYNNGTCNLTLEVLRATLTDVTQDCVEVYNAQEHYITVAANGVLGETVANNRIAGITIIYGTDTHYGNGTENIGIVYVKDSKIVYYKVTSDNYEDLTGSALVTVNKANAVVSADLKYSRVHEDIVPLSTNTSGFRGTDAPIVINLATNANKEQVGLYDITYEVTNVAELSENYNLTVSQGIGAYEVRPPLPPIEPLFPTASDLMYGQTLSQSELTGGEGDGEYAWTNPAAKPGVHQTEASVTFTINDDVNYDYRDYVGYDGDTHTIVRPVAITVHPADFEGISFDGKTETYNGFNKSIPLVTTQALPMGTTVTYMYEDQESLSPFIFRNAGVYTVGVRVYNENYNTFEKFVDLIINQVEARVTADDKSSAYGDDLLALTYTVEGFIGSDAENIVVVLSCDADGDVIGEYEIVVESVADAEDQDVCRNYVLIIVNGTYTVTKAIPEEVVFPTRIRVTHNDRLSNAELEGNSGDGEWSWLTPDKVCRITGQETLLFTPNDTDHYDYSIYEDFDEQTGVISRTVTVIVTDAPMNLTYEDCTREYDGTHYTHNVEGEVPEGATVVYTLTTTERTDTSSNTYNFNMINVGTYVIRVHAECENYLTYEKEVTVTITPITLEAAWTITGSDEYYDDENPFVYNGYSQGIAPVIINKVAGDDVEMSATGNSARFAGEYTATITNELTGASAVNYKFSDEQVMTKTWRIVKATPQEVIYPIAHNAITYGQRLSEIELVNGSGDGEFFWKYPTSIPSVGDNATVIFVPNDTDNYDYTGIALEQNIDIIVNKVILTDADIVYPTTSAVTYETTLSGIPLSHTTNAYGRFAWIDPNLVPTVSTRSATMVFVPNDVRNYDYTSVTLQREIQITVNKKFLNIAAPTLAESSFVYGTKLKDVEFEVEVFEYGKYEWLHPTVKPNVADETAEVVFILSDSDNYYIDELDPSATTKLFVIPITVDPAEFTVMYADRELMYDGMWKSLVQNWMPDGTSVSSYCEETGDSSPDTILMYRDAGVYTLHVTMTNVNYVTKEYVAILTITKRPATLTVNYVQSAIGDPLAELTYVWDAYNLDERGAGIDIELYLTDLEGNVVEKENIDTNQPGTYYIRANVTGTRVDNYDLTVIDAMYLIIDPALSNVTFTGISTTYDGEEYTPEWSNLEGLTLAPDATIKLTYSDYEDEEFYYYSDGEWHYDQLFSFKNAGKHIVTAELNSSNYNSGATVYYQAVILIERLAVEYEWRDRGNQSGPEYTDDTPLIYNGKPQTIIPIILNAVGDDDVYFGIHDYTRHIDCDTYTAAAWPMLQGEDRDNYYYEGSVSRKYEIAPATLTYTANDKTIVYGDAPSNAGYTLTGLQTRDGDVEEESLVVRGRISYSYTYVRYGDVGEYAISIDVSGLHADNYIFESVDGVLTVTPKTLNIIWNTTDDINGMRYVAPYVYTGTTQGVYPFITNLFYGDEVGLTVSDNEHINVGEYTAVIDALTGDDCGNYVLPSVTTCEYFINKALLTVAANDNTITYGDPVTDNGYTITGFVNGETDAVINNKESIALSYNYSQWDDVLDGIFVIYVDITELSADNYDFVDANGRLTVNKYELNSVLWYTDTSYETLYTAAYNYTGYAQGVYPHLGTAALNGDDVYLTTANNVKVNAGTYTTEEVRLAGEKSGNYKLAESVVLTKQFSINKATATVTPRDNVITYGQPASHNGYEVTGFLGSDGVGIIDGTPIYTYTYEQYDDVGEYAISIDVSPLSSTNYNFVAGDDAVLTVNRKAVQIAWYVLGTEDEYVKAFTYNGYAQGVYAVVGNKVNDDDVTLECENNTAVVVGSYVANAVRFSLSGTKAHNYIWNDEQELEMTFAIEKATLNVVANDNAITYGQAPSANGYVITGFVGEDTVETVDIENLDQITFSYTYTQYGNVGTYQILPNVGMLLSENYTFKSVAGELTVNQLEITFVWYTENDLEASEYDEPYIFNGGVQGVYPFITNVVAGATGVLDNVYLNVTGNTAVNVGTYTTSNVVIAGMKSMNYKLPASGLNKVFVINPKPVDIMWCIDDFTYDGTNQFDKVHAHYIDVNGIEVSLALSVADSDFTEVEDEGYYIFSAAFKNGEYNYVLNAPTSKEYHMKPFILDVYWSDVKSYEYNGYDQSDSIEAWYILDNEVHYLVTTCPRIFKDYNNGSPYKFTAEFETPLKNYRLNEDMKTDNYYITQALLLVTVNPSVITYGEDVYASDAYYIDDSQLKGEDTLDVVTGSPRFYSDDYERYGDVGNYTITVDVSGFRAANYYFEPDTPARLKVNPLQAIIGWRFADGTEFERGDTLEYNGEEQGIYPYVTNAVNGDDVSYNVRNNLRKPLGNYSASVTGLTGAKAHNYVLGLSRSMPFEIVPRTVEIEWFIDQEFSAVYAEPYVYNGLFQGIYPKIMNAIDGEDVELNVTGNMLKNVGEQTTDELLIIGTDAGNYRLPESGTTKTFEIVKATLYVNANDADIIFGQEAATNGFTLSGFQGSDTEDNVVISGKNAVTLTAYYDRYEDCGQYVISVDEASIVNLSAQNYEFAMGEDGVLTVNKATLTDATANYVGYYDGLYHTVTFAATGFVNGEDVSCATVVYGTTDSYESGEEPVICKTVADSKAVYYKATFTNYNDIEGVKNVTINRATLTDRTQEVSVIYDGLTYTIIVTVDGVNGESVTGANIDGLLIEYGTDTTYSSGSTNIGAINVVDSKTVYYRITSDNYETLTGYKDIEIRPATPVIVEIPTASDIVYGQRLADSVLTGGLAQYELATGLANVPGTFSWKDATIVPVVIESNTKEFDVVFMPDDTSNYNAVECKVTLTIIKATPTITVDPTASAITYGQTLSASTLTGGEASTEGTFEWTTQTIRPLVSDSQVTEYEVTFIPDDGANYNRVTTTVTLEVYRRLITITSSSVNKVYDGTELTSASCSITSGTLAQGDAVYNLNVATGSITNVGSTANTIGEIRIVKGAVDMTDNYRINAIEGTLRVTPATITYNVSGYDEIYDGAAHTISLTDITTVNAQAYTVKYGTVEGVYDLDAAPTVTNYTAEPFVVYFEITAPNHTAVRGSATVTIGKATPTVTVDPIASAINYGQTLSASTLTGGTVEYDLASGTATVAGHFAWTTPAVRPVVADSGVTEYEVTFTPNDTVNYVSVTTSLTVTVNKLTITVTAPTVTRTYDGTELTAHMCTYSGTIAQGDAIQSLNIASGSITNVGSTSNVVGAVVIVRNSVDMTENYIINKVDGTLTITEAEITYTVDSYEDDYDGTAHTISLTDITTVNAQEYTVKYGTVEGVYNLDAAPTVTNYTAEPFVVYFEITAPNHATVRDSATVTINKATPEITVAPTATGITYGQTLADSTVTGTASTAGAFSFIDTSVMPDVTDSGVTEYAVQFIPTDTTNYVSVTSGLSVTVTVSKATPDITTEPTASAITYGQTLADSTLTGGVAKYNLASGQVTVEGTFTWKYPSTAPSVSESGYYFEVVFTPTDTARYETVEEIGVTVVVNSARLTAPVLSYNANTKTLSWTASEHAVGYALSIAGEQLNVTSYVVPDLQDGFTATVVAVAPNENYLDSNSSNAITRLSKPTGLAVSDGTLTFNAVAGATVYTVYADGASIGTTDTTSFSLVGMLDEGSSDVTVVANTSASGSYDSLSSAALSVTQLAESESVVCISDVMEWSAVAGASGYKVKFGSRTVDCGNVLIYNVTATDLTALGDGTPILVAYSSSSNVLSSETLCEEFNEFTNDGVTLSYARDAEDSSKLIVTGFVSSSRTLSFSIPSTIGSSTVVAIADSAFLDNASITEVALGATIESIGKYAFDNSSIKRITFAGDSALTVIDDYAFAFSDLESITIPKSVENIGYAAFYGCDSLESIMFETNSSLDTIESFAFGNVTGVSELDIPSGVDSIDEAALAGMTGLTSLSVPFVGQSATATGREALSGYVFGTADTLENGLTVIPDHVAASRATSGANTYEYKKQILSSYGSVESFNDLDESANWTQETAYSAYLNVLEVDNGVQTEFDNKITLNVNPTSVNASDMLFARKGFTLNDGYDYTLNVELESDKACTVKIAIATSAGVILDSENVVLTAGVPVKAVLEYTADDDYASAQMGVVIPASSNISNAMISINSMLASYSSSNEIIGGFSELNDEDKWSGDVWGRWDGGGGYGYALYLDVLATQLVSKGSDKASQWKGDEPTGASEWADGYDDSITEIDLMIDGSYNWSYMQFRRVNIAVQANVEYEARITLSASATSTLYFRIERNDGSWNNFVDDNITVTTTPTTFTYKFTPGNNLNAVKAGLYCVPTTNKAAGDTHTSSSIPHNTSFTISEFTITSTSSGVLYAAGNKFSDLADAGEDHSTLWSTDRWDNWGEGWSNYLDVLETELSQGYDGGTNQWASGMEGGDGNIVLYVNTPGSYWDSMDFLHYDVAIIAGLEYEFEFEASATVALPVSMVSFKTYDAWNFYMSEPVTIGTSSNVYRARFIAPETTDHVVVGIRIPKDSEQSVITITDWNLYEVYDVLGATDLSMFFNDEFDGTALNGDIWKAEIGDGSEQSLMQWGNNEKEYYRPENATVSDGELAITAKYEVTTHYESGDPIATPYNYTSARIQTRDTVTATYGRVEARIKLPSQSGLWPAFWMLPATLSYSSWPRSGEIDIMEANCGEPTWIVSTLHWAPDYYNRWYSTYKSTRTELDITEYHEYAIEWTEEGITWFVDDEPVSYVSWLVWTSTYGISETAPFDQGFYIILNLAVGGNFIGGTTPSGWTTGSQESMYVDYVRAYGLTESKIDYDGAEILSSTDFSDVSYKDTGAETADWLVYRAYESEYWQGNGTYEVNDGKLEMSINNKAASYAYDFQVEQDVMEMYYGRRYRLEFTLTSEISREFNVLVNGLYYYMQGPNEVTGYAEVFNKTLSVSAGESKTFTFEFNNTAHIDYDGKYQLVFQFGRINGNAYTSENGNYMILEGVSVKEIDTLNKLKSRYETITDSGLVETAQFYIADGENMQDIFMIPTELGELNITNGSATIARGAFANLTGLNKLTYATTVTSVEAYAFYNCFALTDLPAGFVASVTSVGDYAFYNCGVNDEPTHTSTASLVETVGEYAFYNAKFVTTLPASTDVVFNNYAYAGTGITGAVDLSAYESLTAFIPEGVFAGTGLSEVTIAESVETIKAHAFEGCTALESVDGYDGMVIIGDYAFADCTALEGAPIGDYTKSVGNHAFENCTSLTNETLPSSLAIIGKYAFAGCEDLATVTFIYTTGSGRKGACTIDDYAFANTAITAIDIPESVMSFGQGVFVGCDNLATVKIAGSTTGSTNVNYTKTILYVKNNVIYGKYNNTSYSILYYPSTKTATNVSIESLINDCFGAVSGGVTISNSAFAGNTHITTLTVYGSVTAIGTNAFNGCSNLSSVTLNSGLLSIATQAFKDTALTSVTLPTSLENMGYDVFSGCTLTVTFYGTTKDSFSPYWDRGATVTYVGNN